MFGDSIITRHPNTKPGSTHEWVYALKYRDPTQPDSVYTPTSYAIKHVTTISMKSFIRQGFVQFVENKADLPDSHIEMYNRIWVVNFGMYILSDEGLRDRGINPDVLRASLALGVKI